MILITHQRDCAHTAAQRQHSAVNENASIVLGSCGLEAEDCAAAHRSQTIGYRACVFSRFRSGSSLEATQNTELLRFPRTGLRQS